MNMKYLENKKQPITRAGMVLALVFLLLGNTAFAQSKYDFQVTGGYTISDHEFDMNGYNVDISVNRKIWDVISGGIYLDYANVDNLIPEVNGNGSSYSGNYIPPTLKNYLISLSPYDLMTFSQNMTNFLSYGVKINLDFKVSRKFKLGFYGGMGLTTRKWASYFVSTFRGTTNHYESIQLSTIFLKTTEFSLRWGIKFTYGLSRKINLVLQLGDNNSKYKKYSTGFTTYQKANLGVAIKL